MPNIAVFSMFYLRRREDVFRLQSMLNILSKEVGCDKI